MGHLERRIWWRHSFFDPRKGQLHVKLAQIRSNFKMHMFTNIRLSCADLPQDSKNVIYCYVRQLEIPKNCISKKWRHHHYLFFWPLQSQIQRYGFEILHAWCLYESWSHTFFFDNLKVSDFIGNYSSKVEILSFGGQNLKISKIRDNHFVERSILHRLAFFDRVLLQNWTF